MWRKIKPHTDLHEVLDGWHEPFCASHRYVIDKYLYFGSQSHGNRNLAFYFIEMEQSVTKNLANADVYKVFLAPRVGLEPTTPRLTAVCSTIELSRIILLPGFYPQNCILIITYFLLLCKPFFTLVKPSAY